MADAAYKLSLFYVHETERTAGWSESWFTTQSNLLILTGPRDDPAQGIAWKLALASAKLHGRTAVCKYIRCSQIAPPKASVIVNTRWSYNGEVATAEETDQSSNALNLRLFGGAGKTSDHQIRGIPDTQINDNGRYVPKNSYQQRVQQFVEFLRLNSFVIRFKDETVPKLPIELVSQTGIVTITGHPYVNGDYVRVGLVRGITQANGLWRVTKIDANTFQLRGFITTTATLAKSLSMYAQKIQYDSVSPDDHEITFGTSRKVGRPTRVRVGRRKTRAI